MNSVRLNPLDSAWLFTESRATPNHVGGLLQFKLPEGAPKDYMRKMMADFRSHREFTAPWNRRLKYAFNKNPVPVWIEDDDIDLEYHVRHAALPWPGGERELGELVGRLQSTPLDLSRPPWECNIIEGLEGDRFALFIKMHHSLIDGVSGMKLLQRAMSPDREASGKLPPFWASGLPRPVRARDDHPLPTVANAAAMAVEALRGQARTVPQLVVAFGRMLKGLGTGEGMVVPFTSPQSMLNGRVREKRRFATQQFPMERLRNLARAAECTLNDVVLAICGGALRRFLEERGDLPAQSLTTGIPVSVRPIDDEGSGNAITFVIATLGTDIVDARERLAAIRESVRHAKAHVQSLPRQAMLQYTVLLMAPTILTLLTGIGGRTRPMFNITISNVPGPDQTLYFRGAELVAIYPASIVTHGQALNITCESYAGAMNFGFTGCHASLPSMQRLAVYAEGALAELEAAMAPKRARGKPATAKKGQGSEPGGKAAATKRRPARLGKD
ncbi:MAG: wax ester/triacylglycerol synthase family O-acyltransferase [Sulfuritalea sp.]|nr:wax ester/triacylglycerol synthase family O-acyltransferase [Sulfuritalea sp.]MBK8762437.1 wax ester/triacylglycerol synthase family O-acyltransferase [Sulfuritalea sp.]MBK9352351.1 wax ester/triacylglycerol synthase family O-acyltransferase [Sulfuritalea sp.]MBP6636309.1 wax ester/triacylglycerol synthase family O-acyltransferase [Sulfuritalea sp.]MBP7422791.1 wax ester/triacylglycerol synthase family O-acyltransferase [Sulfuritalea sp.]